MTIFRRKEDRHIISAFLKLGCGIRRFLFDLSPGHTFEPSNMDNQKFSKKNDSLTYNLFN
jgi:hypothetical protein